MLIAERPEIRRLRTSGSIAKTISRSAIASCSACNEPRCSRTVPRQARIPRIRRPRQPFEFRRVTAQLQAQKLQRRARKFAKTHSIPQPADEICRIPELLHPLRSLTVAFDLSREAQENQEHERDRHFQHQRHSLLQADHQKQRNHRKPLPSRTPQPLNPPRKAEQIAEVHAPIRSRRHARANASDGKKARQNQLNEQSSVWLSIDCSSPAA